MLSLSCLSPIGAVSISERYIVSELLCHKWDLDADSIHSLVSHYISCSICQITLLHSIEEWILWVLSKKLSMRNLPLSQEGCQCRKCNRTHPPLTHSFSLLLLTDLAQNRTFSGFHWHRIEVATRVIACCPGFENKDHCFCLFKVFNPLI